MKFDEDKVEEMRRSEIEYEDSLKKIREWRGLDYESHSG